ncbi:ribonuclease P 40kDa subunit-domain-containing protein [Hygrophoropsis aurantiaca]|uniref:Ribonuclease P 40kDa subunit-domain-containing protein n=1 Tax=Hygrophoropsis aurantiaca TaxID=72124 RepID=A0ACB8APR2_9AGAM|nr:ribonuclease P 40kDa subunit-domain-containing protein [Hygrophoropsis aurantiaca]
MERRHVKLSYGDFSSVVLKEFGTRHLFNRQVNIVFPSSDVLEDALSQLETTYYKANFSLSEAHEYASEITPCADDGDSYRSFLAVPDTDDCDDTWCIDQRGVLTLCISKILYEKLGLIGENQPIKNRSEQYFIHIPPSWLAATVESAAIRDREVKGLRIWDDIRTQAGLGRWQVVYHAMGTAVTPTHEVLKVKPHIERFTDVYVPIPALAPCPAETFKDIELEDEAQEWQDKANELFEWVGLACLGAQRLKANDRVDPYVSVYDPPSPSRIGNTTQLCWKGLLHPTFIQSLDMTSQSISSLLSRSESNDQRFIALSRHGYPRSPVASISTKANHGAKKASFRHPQLDSEDTSCLILTATHSEQSNRFGQVMMGESKNTKHWDASWI